MKKKVILCCFILVGSILFHFSNVYGSENRYPNSHRLVSVNWLKENIGNEKLLIIDTRDEGYEDGHISGAVHLPVDQIIDKKHSVPGMLVSGTEFENVMNNIGLTNDQTVVVYDDGGSPSAARVFYALEYFGHEDVRLLNGGLKAWQRVHPVSRKQPELKEGSFQVDIKKSIAVDKEYVKSVIGREGVVLLDVRTPEEYRGEKVWAKRGGHIPTAMNLEWKKVLKDDEIPYFRSASDISNMLKEVGVEKDKKIVVYCHTAKRASHMYFTLRLMGYKDLHVYEGSWAEWGNDPDTPIEK